MAVASILADSLIYCVGSPRASTKLLNLLYARKSVILFAFRFELVWACLFGQLYVFEFNLSDKYIFVCFQNVYVK